VDSVLAISIAGCATSGKSLPVGAVPMPAPAVFQQWYARTQECSGLRGSFATLQWFVVPGVSSFRTNDGPAVGMWKKGRGSGSIILAGNFAERELVVRHEMLHSLIGRSGHPSELFVDRCRLTWNTWAAESTNNP
jgi:hypothetical protein